VVSRKKKNSLGEEEGVGKRGVTRRAGVDALYSKGFERTTRGLTRGREEKQGPLKGKKRGGAFVSRNSSSGGGGFKKIYRKGKLKILVL